MIKEKKWAVNTTRLLIREIEFVDSEMLVKWRSNPEITQFFFNPEPLTLEKHLKWFERYTTNETRIDFIILEKESHMPVGTVGLQNIDMDSKQCSVAYMIGETSARGKGYAVEAIQEVCNFAFKEFSLQKIHAEIQEDNIASKKMVQKIGFKYQEAADYKIQNRAFNVYTLIDNKEEK